MSTDQADDDPTNDTDQSDKSGLLDNFTNKCSNDRDATSPKTGEQSLLIKEETGKKHSGRTSKDSKGINDSRVSFGDICRICHMGGFTTTGENGATWERQNQAVRGVDSQISTLSSYGYLGPLISACKCRGTVALVHAECLERWLTESGHTRCELCGYKYATKRVLRHNIFRSVVIWFNTIIVSRQMLLDLLYLIVTTPLALFSCYICALTVKMLIKNGFHNIPWMLIAMLPTCSITLVAYWGWMVTMGRLHGHQWRRYWRNNFVIQLDPDNTNHRNETSNDRSFERESNNDIEDPMEIF